MIWQLVRKMYITATNSYNKYCALFGERSFPAQVGQVERIGHLEGKRLKNQKESRDTWQGFAFFALVAN